VCHHDRLYAKEAAATKANSIRVVLSMQYLDESQYRRDKKKLPRRRAVRGARVPRHTPFYPKRIDPSRPCRRAASVTAPPSRATHQFVSAITASLDVT